ncbi:hypothetical protein ACQ4PT_059211 [Festuca glaucescens]
MCCEGQPAKLPDGQPALHMARSSRGHHVHGLGFSVSARMCEAAKSSWPELLRVKAEAAKHKIMRDRPDVQVIVVPADSMVTADVNTKRVRVFINTSNNKVVKVPKIG